MKHKCTIDDSSISGKAFKKYAKTLDFVEFEQESSTKIFTFYPRNKKEEKALLAFADALGIHYEKY